MQSLWNSLSALKSSSSWLDTIGNNIANQSTPGFAAQNITFADALTAARTPSAGNAQQAGRYTPTTMAGGTGVITTGLESDFSQMPLQQTGQQTDVAIQGPGFFRVQTPNGVELTKAGNFQWSLNTSGQDVLSTPDGNPVLDVNGKPVLRAGSPNANMTISPSGQVSFGTVKGQKIAIVEVTMPSQTLASAGQNAYAAQAGATPRIVNAGANAQSNSTLVQGSLSMSNVNLTTQMTAMIQAQRMFDLNAEALQLTNRMAGDANNIRQG